MNDPIELLIKNLQGEDSKAEIEIDNNPIQFSYQNKDYLFHLTNISSWQQRPHMRRIQIRKSLKEKLIKLHRYYIFGIFGYDNQTDTYSTWSSNYLENSFSVKSLYTYKDYLDSATDYGISQHINKDNTDLSSIHFQSKYLGIFLSHFNTKNLNLNGEEYAVMTFDHLHTKNGFLKIKRKIDKLHSLTFVSNADNKLSKKWDREEYLVTLNLYFDLQKNDRTKSKFSDNDPKVVEVLKFLKKRSQINKTSFRSISSLSLRHANYQSVDPLYRGTGLTGGGSKVKEFFQEFVNNQAALTEEIKKINDKYKSTNVGQIGFEINDYEEKDPNLKISLPIKGFDEEDIRNKQERATGKHIYTLNILANYLRNLGLNPLEDSQTFDMFAYDESQAYIFEAKSITEKNFRTQVRHALVQLDEYIFKHQINKTKGFTKKISKTIIFDQNPNNIIDRTKVEFYLKFIAKNGILIMYIEDDKVRTL